MSDKIEREGDSGGCAGSGAGEGPGTKLYLASSWRNREQPRLLAWLRENGFEVYDFRNPAPGNTGFQWSEIDPEWETWTPREFQAALGHEVAEKGFALDRDALLWADAGVLLLPSGASSHAEAGYLAGLGKPVYVLLDQSSGEPELMYKLFSGIASTPAELLVLLRSDQGGDPAEWPEHLRVREYPNSKKVVR